jgi:hypothetical protein
MLTDRDLAVEYARRFHLEPRRDDETGPQFRARVVRELYAAGRRAAARDVLVNDRRGERGGETLAWGVLEPILGNAAAVRQIAEHTQAIVDRVGPRRRTLWPGRPRMDSIYVPISPERDANAGALVLGILDRSQTAVDRVGPRRRTLWPRNRRSRSVHLIIDLGVTVVDGVLQRDPMVTDRDLAEDYVGRFGLEPRREDEPAAEFRERVAGELHARGEGVAAQEVLFNRLTGDGFWAELLLEHRGGDAAVRWLAEQTQADLDRARRPWRSAWFRRRRRAQVPPEPSG